jgi:hypothetical protein
MGGPLWPVILDGDNPDGKRCPLIVSDRWKRVLGVFSADQGLVVGEVNHKETRIKNVITFF